LTPVITLESWRQLLDLVEQTRREQRHYRRTMDPRSRRRAETLEARLDASITLYTAAMHAAAVEVEAEVLGVPAIGGEGGVP
jgi:hypothetical protein